MLRASFDQKGARYELVTECSGESFVTEPGKLSTLVADAVEEVVGHRPELSTTGGTSDARFIRRLCPVVEFGLVGQTMPKVEERVRSEERRVGKACGIPWRTRGGLDPEQ